MIVSNKTSVIIPSYKDPHLQKTIKSVLKAHKEDIEIIVVLDGGGAADHIFEHDKVKYIVLKDRVGMRVAINIGAGNSSGKYIMKIDSHCDISEGFDVNLKKDLKKNWVAIPSRYNLDVKNWKKFNGPIEHLYLKFPDNLEKEIGFRSRVFAERAKLFNHDITPDIITFQGSCWFMHRDYFYHMNCLDEKTFGSFGMEAHEISMKTWLVFDGKVICNRNAWNAHYSPNTRKSRSTRRNMLDNMKKVFRLDMLNEWPGQNKPFKWLIDKFGPFPGWPENWHTDEYINNLKRKGYICKDMK